MTQAFWRLLLICAVAAAGETVAIALGAFDVVTVVGVVLGAAAYVLTNDLDGPRRGRGNVTYWRGRRVDRDDRGKWN